MARTYGKLMSSIWRDDDFKRLPNAETQLLYLALISQPDLSPCGRLTVALGRWADGIAGSDRKAVTAGLEALEDARFILVDWNNDELLVRSFIRHDNGLGNPRRRAAIKNAAQEIGSPALPAAIKSENPGVFDTEIEDIHSFDHDDGENDETAGQSANVQRTTVEPDACTSMPNQGDVNREPGTVSSDPESPHLPTGSTGGVGKSLRKKQAVIERIVQHRVEQLGKQVGTGYLVKVRKDVIDAKGATINRLVQMFPDAPIDSIAHGAETGDTRNLAHYAQPTEEQP